ncbi:MAG: succinate dehydrogenase/fumarate reductase iron-sulfur subunit [Candidatus Sumerlaeaceae bacterium]
MSGFTVTVRRFAPQTDSSAYYEQHHVELAERASVLDALFAIQRTTAPDLAFRFSCRVGMCGSCAMVVNGRETLTCSTLAKQFGDKLKIEPMRNMPVARDLAVDMEPFFSAYKRSLPYFIPRADLHDFFPIPHGSPEWQAMDHQPQCIDCGACYSSCTVVSASSRYLGPMQLHRALNLITDPRDGERAERMRVIESEAGAFRCHTLGNCREACPRGISPTASIARLKRLAFSHQLRQFFARLLPGTRL